MNEKDSDYIQPTLGYRPVIGNTKEPRHVVAVPEKYWLKLKEIKMRKGITVQHLVKEMLEAGIKKHEGLK